MKRFAVTLAVVGMVMLFATFAMGFYAWAPFASYGGGYGSSSSSSGYYPASSSSSGYWGGYGGGYGYGWGRRAARGYRGMGWGGYGGYGYALGSLFFQQWRIQLWLQQQQQWRIQLWFQQQQQWRLLAGEQLIEWLVLEFQAEQSQLGKKQYSENSGATNP